MNTPRLCHSWTAHAGQSFVIRQAAPADALQILAHTRAVLTEPEWNITELREFRHTVAEEEAWIHSFQDRPHSILLVADFGVAETPLITGILAFNTQNRFRTRHRGRLGISVQAPYRRLGVGEALLETLLTWAKVEPELERVELSVFAHNGRAISLYRKPGFQEEARLSRAFKLANGAYYDDVMMVRWVK